MSNNDSQSSAGTPMQNDPNSKVASSTASTPAVKSERSSRIRKRTWAEAIKEQSNSTYIDTEPNSKHEQQQNTESSAHDAQSTFASTGLGFSAATSSAKQENSISAEHQSNSSTATNASSMQDDDESFGAKMLRKMGLQKGAGLGAQQQGITTPIEASQQQQQRAGLGFEPLLRLQSHKYESFAIEIEIHPNWYDRTTPQAADIEKPQNITDEEAQFCI
jgi:hypothetical protein